MEQKKFFSSAKVLSCNDLTVEVCKLSVKLPSHSSLPESGQFFMIRSKPSSVFLCRPISVYAVKQSVVDFLILKRGRGTKELCSLSAGNEVDLIGPLGNSFPRPDSKLLNDNGKNPRVAIIGGGIGIAPVAGFASTLPSKSYDFYASFRTGCYGTDSIDPAELVITTNDGTYGIRGMLPVVFTADVIKNKNYSVVYACGPEPLLIYVQTVCKDAGIKCYLSMESKMACGVGVCLGCTLLTVDGIKHCCKDGPVFLGETIVFEKQIPVAKQQDTDQRR